MSIEFWPKGKVAALSLTFDDARPSQVDHGFPLLDSYGVQATFYVSIQPMRDRKTEWKQSIKNGHEIGNHTFNHPCSGNFSFARNKPLEEYNLEQMRDEILKANSCIEQELGIQPKTFAYPCGQKFVGRSKDVRSYVPLVAEYFLVGRDAFNEVPNDPTFTDLAQVTALDMDDVTFETVQQYLDYARKHNSWLIFLGHEISDQGKQTVNISVLEKLCQFLKDGDIWVDTVENIGTYINQKRSI